MDVFLKAAAGTLIAVVLYLVLSKQSKDIALLLTIASCCIVISATITYLHPIIDFFRSLQAMGNLDSELFGILMKVVGIGILSEIISLICIDAGNTSLGKAIQMLTSVVILWLSLPLLNRLLELIETILEAV